MDASLEQQIAVLKRIPRRLGKEDAKLVLAAEQTLNRLLALRRHIQSADHDNETESNLLADELLSLLALPRADNVVKS